ncbi:hypothetical protein CHLRE_14g623125v5 [Chlamydomonas reinhardtii]|uniref:Uncharacterized protein n=1 Tax=Chlamydomonas reinhardtii TaxID=3055 RepID=A0A2K3CY47_CHLRE|nr:uncharacterized protein CHLRE_14g623125v5 [Chlamydomonas reinhardtii]PNW73207.1 hypothetical protein CHLRE_14g623125v5 [Chlamydomonas reinhardtii]
MGDLQNDWDGLRHLADVLRQLDVHAQRHFVAALSSCSQLGDTRLTCHALRDIVDHNLENARFRVPRRNFAAGLRHEQQSLLARFQSCRSLTIVYSEEDDVGSCAAEQPQPTPEQVAPLCVSTGVGVRELRLESRTMGLADLVACVATLRLPNVRVLELRTSRQEDNDGLRDSSSHAALSALRAALPLLEELRLPYTSYLLGLGAAFSGSSLTSVGVSMPGLLSRPQVRGLLQLQQLRNLEVLASPGEHVGGSGEIGAQVADSVRGGGGVPGDADDAATLAGLHVGQAEHLWALRLLLTSLPPALQRVKFSSGFGMTAEVAIRLEAGQVQSIERDSGYVQTLNNFAAVLLPRLAASGQRRVPSIKLGKLWGNATTLISYLQPQRPLARLLRLCDSVELEALIMDVPVVPVEEEGFTANERIRITSALRAVVQAFGCWPTHVHTLAGYLGCRLAINGTAAAEARSSSAAGVDRPAADAAAAYAATAAGAAGAFVGVTAERVLGRAEELMWGKAAAQDRLPGLLLEGRAPPVDAAVGAPSSAQAAGGSRSAGERLHVLLRGPVVRLQLLDGTCSSAGGADGDGDDVGDIDGRGGSGGGSGSSGSRTTCARAGLQSWLKCLMQEPCGGGGAGAGATGGLLPWDGERCAAAGSTMIVACDTPEAALRLARGAVADGGLEVVVLRNCTAGIVTWMRHIDTAVQELWDDHYGSSAVASAGGGGGEGAALAAATGARGGALPLAGAAAEPQEAKVAALVRLLELAGRSQAAVATNMTLFQPQAKWAAWST